MLYNKYNNNNKTDYYFANSFRAWKTRSRVTRENSRRDRCLRRLFYEGRTDPLIR